MPSKAKIGTSKTLGSFCQSDSSFKTRIAQITFETKRNSDFAGRFILLFEYLQLFSQSILLNPSMYKNPKYKNPLVFEIIIYFFKLVNPCYLLNYEKDDGLTKATLIVVFFFAFFKCLLAFYILCVASGVFKRKNYFLIGLWRWVFRLQGRVFCYLIASFWARAIIKSEQVDFSVLSVGKIWRILVYAILIAIEYGFSFVLEYFIRITLEFKLEI